MNLKFVSSALSGKNDVWRYCVGLVTILGCWLTSATIAQTALITPFPGGDGEFSRTAESPALGALDSSRLSALMHDYVLLNLPFVVFGACVIGVVAMLHRRSPLTLITPKRQFCYQRFWAGFGVWLVLSGGQMAIEYGLRPAAFTHDFQVQHWLLFVPVALILTPLQTSAEEIFFRGYLLQALGLLIRQPVVLAIVTSLPFAMVHLANPEMGRDALWMGLSYFLLAIFLTVITLADGRLELALGVHAANNLFVVLLVNTPDSALPTPALFVQYSPSPPRLTFMLLLAASGIFYIVFFNRKKQRPIDTTAPDSPESDS